LKGCLSATSRIKNLAGRWVGWPNTIRRLHALAIFRLRLPLSSSPYFPIFYPLALLNRVFGSDAQRGCEVIIKAAKSG